MKKKMWLVKYLKIFILTGFLTLLSFSQAYAEEKEIDLNTNPNDYLFKAYNIKPGDWMPRNITIQNDGKQNFRYTAVVEDTKSIKGLFEELELLVMKDTTVLFDGLLKDFAGLSPRFLAKGSQETLFFQVTMPFELGNEFQGSAAEAKIVFYAEGIDTPPPSCEEDPSQSGCDQPPTCEEDPTQSGCDQPPTCEEDPSQSGCEQPPTCEEDPTQSGCEQPPTCEEDPTQSGCEQPPTCEEDPSQSGCEQPPGGDPEDPGDQDGNPPTEKPDVQEVVVTPDIVNHLPNTATNSYNLLVIGVILLGSGGSILLLLYRRLRYGK